MKKRMEVDTFNNTEKMRTTEVTNHKLWPKSILWNTRWETNGFCGFCGNLIWFEEQVFSL